MQDSPTLVTNSLKKARWVVPDANIDGVTAIVRAHDVPEIVARMLVARGVQPDDIPAFLNPTFKDLSLIHI